jgi:hypothetical protein
LAIAIGDWQLDWAIDDWDYRRGLPRINRQSTILNRRSSIDN